MDPIPSWQNRTPDHNATNSGDHVAIASYVQELTKRGSAVAASETEGVTAVHGPLVPESTCRPRVPRRRKRCRPFLQTRSAPFLGCRTLSYRSVRRSS